MRENHSLLRIGGPLLSILLVIFFINRAVNQFQADQIKAADAARLESQSAAPAEAAAPAPAEVPAAQPAAATAPQPVSAGQPIAAQPIAAEPTAPADVVAAINGAGCAGCHVIPGVPGANGQVGPDLSEIGVTATARVEGLSAEEYIRQSIQDPNAFIAPTCGSNPCPAGVMLQSFAQTLSDS